MEEKKSRGVYLVLCFREKVPFQRGEQSDGDT